MPDQSNSKNLLLAAALKYAELGLPVLPCGPNKRPLVARDKDGQGKPIPKTGGLYKATTDPEQIKKWWRKWPKALIAVRTGKVSGIAVLDLDCKNDKDGFAAVPDWQQRTSVIVRTASGGAHLYFRADGAPHCTASEIAPGVDTRGDGGYVILPPSPGYEFLNGVDLAELKPTLPPWPNDLRPPARSQKRMLGQEPEADPALIATAMLVIPNADRGWDDWNRIGMALFRATGGREAGFRTFDAFSQKSKKYDAEATAERWEHYSNYPPDQIGAGTIFYEAKQHGWVRPRHWLGDDGPTPLGFTRDGNFACLDQTRSLIILASANQLLSPQWLLGLMPSRFWIVRFPSDNKMGFSPLAAGEALMEACRGAGPFDPLRVRGRGIWREGDAIIINLGEPVPPTTKCRYICFEPVKFAPSTTFDVKRLLDPLWLFPWKHPQDAMLLLGWAAFAPICGVFEWRPHCFVWGGPQTGKTTLHTLLRYVLSPLVLPVEGGSSEAGIRQMLGADSLPIIIDEFESDQQNVHRILKLVRSASSADSLLLRGTPEGRAMQFSLRTTFLMSAVNCGGLSPADQSRILLLELTKHNKDKETARRIEVELAYFRDLGPSWCGHMVSLAGLMQPALGTFQQEMPAADRHHQQNFATILAAAFVALNERSPAADEAQLWIKDYARAMERHAEEAERDNPSECLEHLKAHVVDHNTLGRWIATAISPPAEGSKNNALRILNIYGIAIREVDGGEMVCIRNGSPNIDVIFRGTAWKERGWQRALRGLDGARASDNPVWFGEGRQGKKERATAIPVDYFPDEPIGEAF